MVIQIIETFFVLFFSVFLPLLLNLLLLGPYCLFLYYARPCMECSLGISSFLEEISSLSHSIVSLCFFALFTLKGFLMPPRSSLEHRIQWHLSLSSLPFASLISLAICNTFSNNHFAFFFFFFGMVLKSPSRSFCSPSDLGSVMGEAIWWLISQELSSWFGCKSLTQVFFSG